MKKNERLLLFTLGFRAFWANGDNYAVAPLIINFARDFPVVALFIFGVSFVFLQSTLIMRAQSQLLSLKGPAIISLRTPSGMEAISTRAADA